MIVKLQVKFNRVAHICNLSTWEAVSRESLPWGHPSLHTYIVSLYLYISTKFWMMQWNPVNNLYMWIYSNPNKISNWNSVYHVLWVYFWAFKTKPIDISMVFLLSLLHCFGYCTLAIFFRHLELIWTFYQLSILLFQLNFKVMCQSVTITIWIGIVLKLWINVLRNAF